MGRPRPSLIIAVVLMVVAVPVTMFVAPGQSPIGSVSADIGTEGCLDDAATFAFSPMTVVYSNYQDQCWNEGTDLDEGELETLNENETYDKTLTLVDTRDNEERLIDTLLNQPRFSKDPVRQEAELTFASEYVNNSTETAAITASRNTIKTEYNQRLQGLALRYNRDMRNSQLAYQRLNETGSAGHLHVYVNGSEVDTSNGVTFSVPTDQNDTTNGTAYSLPNGDNVQIATVTVGGTSYDFRNDDLAITMDDPAGDLIEVPITGTDKRHEVGAEAYDPADEGYTSESADIVIAADGSGDYTDFVTGVQAATADQVVYVVEGTYDISSTASIGAKNVTLVGEKGAVVNNNQDSSSGTWAVEATGDNVTIKGINLDATGSRGFRVGGSANSVVEFVTVQYPDRNDYALYGSTTSRNNLLYTNSDSYLPLNGFLRGAFHSFSQEMIEEQKSDRDEILTAFGDSSSGYLHDVWNQLETDQINVTDILTYEQMMTQSFSEDDIGSRAWLDAQYMQAGMSGHDMQSTVVVEVKTNSTVFAGAKKSGGSTLSSSQQYEGHLWTMNPPSSAWETNKTYDTANLGGKLFITHYQQKEYYEDGELVVEMVPATTAVEGQFELVEIYNDSGTSVNTVEHGGTPSNDPYNASTYSQDIELMNQRIMELQEEFEKDGGGASSDSCGISVPIPFIDGGVCTGLGSVGATVAAAAVGIAGAYGLMATGLPKLMSLFMGRKP